MSQTMYQPYQMPEVTTNTYKALQITTKYVSDPVFETNQMPQCVSVPNSVYCSSSRQRSLTLYVRIQLCILFQQQADVITNVCPYPTLYTVLVAGRRHCHCVSVPNSVYCSSSRQTSLPMCVRTQLCILFQQQADVITIVCSYPTLYTVLVAGRRHYHCVSVPNSVYCASSRQTALPLCLRTQLCILFQQQADVITIVCSYPTLYTVLVAGRHHYQCVSYPTLNTVLVV